MLDQIERFGSPQGNSLPFDLEEAKRVLTPGPWARSTRVVNA